MTYFEDLSPYVYCGSDNIKTDQGWITYRPRYERLNVGWIDTPHDFVKGPTPPWLPGALLDIIAGPRINSMRGFHQCTFCQRPTTTPSSTVEAEHPGGKLFLGHAEIRVPVNTRRMLAAPTLIWHYVTVHQYRPPAVFVEAVENYDPDWTADPSPWIPEDADHRRID